MAKSEAMAVYQTALRNKIITRLGVCEICGSEEDSGCRAKIRGHHWKGYDYPVEVWWVCPTCNVYLDRHDGSLTINEAKSYVEYAKASRQTAIRLHSATIEMIKKLAAERRTSIGKLMGAWVEEALARELAK